MKYFLHLFSLIFSALFIAGCASTARDMTSGLETPPNVWEKPEESKKPASNAENTHKKAPALTQNDRQEIEGIIS